MNKEILELVTKIFTFLKLEDYTKLTNILSMIEKEFPDYYKFFEKFKDKSMGEKASNVLSNIFESLTLGGTPLALLGKKAEKEENAKDSYNQNKTDGEVVKESKYPWLLPSSIIASIVILAIVIYIMRKYVKNK